MRYRALICAAQRRMLVCGLRPGHRGPHHDIEWPVTWRD